MGSIFVLKIMAQTALNRLGNLSAVLAVGTFTVSQCLYNVDGGERVVMFDSLRGGVMDKVSGEGTHFMIPVIQRPIVMDIRTKPREIPSMTGTKDLQMVNSTFLFFEAQCLFVCVFMCL